MRKVLGLYERELNHHLERMLPLVYQVLDVGASDGYFTLGCAAAFRNKGRSGKIIAFEPQEQLVEALHQSIEQNEIGGTEIKVVQSLVGFGRAPGVLELDSVRWSSGDPTSRNGTLIKIDVEGAEVDVLKGGTSWLNHTNQFVIEVHQEAFLETIVHLFAQHGLRLKRIDQRPLPLLGREQRSKENWWLVSDPLNDGL